MINVIVCINYSEYYNAENSSVIATTLYKNIKGEYVHNYEMCIRDRCMLSSYVDVLCKRVQVFTKTNDTLNSI